MVTWWDDLNSNGDTYTLWYSINGVNWYVLRKGEPVIVSGHQFVCNDGDVSITFKPIASVAFRFCLTLTSETSLLESDIETTDKVKSKIETVLVP